MKVSSTLIIIRQLLIVASMPLRNKKNKKIFIRQYNNKANVKVWPQMPNILVNPWYPSNYETHLKNLPL